MSYEHAKQTWWNNIKLTIIVMLRRQNGRWYYFRDMPDWLVHKWAMWSGDWDLEDEEDAKLATISKEAGDEVLRRCEAIIRRCEAVAAQAKELQHE
jgi:hypothetical protein